MSKLIQSLIIITFLIFLSSCATTSDRYREGDNRGQATDITVQDEIKMTREILPEMRKQYPPVRDPALQAYVSSIGRKLVRASNLEGRPYHYNFTVVDVGYVNAFALPAGTVFVTAPLIAMANSEAELAGVIGHEIGHIMARHTAERMDRQKKGRTKSILYSVFGGIAGGAAGYGAGKLLCKKGDKKCLAKATLAGGAVGVGGSLLIQKYRFMQNSQEDEMEADRIGFKIATKAGYSKDHVGKFYENLLKMEKQHGGNKNSGFMKSLADAMSTHPPSENRVRQMNQMAAGAPGSGRATVSTRGFTSAKRKVALLMRAKKK